MKIKHFTMLMFLLTGIIRVSGQTPISLQQFLGTWSGKLVRQKSAESEPHGSQVLWRIHKIEIKNGANCVVNLTQESKTPGITRPETKYLEVAGSWNQDTLTLELNETATCTLSLALNIQPINGNDYLNAKTVKRIPDCNIINLSLKRLDRNTAPYVSGKANNGTDLNTPDEDPFAMVLKEQPAEKKLPKTTFAPVAMLGGETPEALGKLLLQALKTNNKKLWISCIHPEQLNEFSVKRFDEFREWLEEDGISNWALVQFNRVTFTLEYMGSNDRGIVRGNKVRRNFVIEFSYKNGEFVGGLGKMTISTYKQGNKFLLWFPGKDTGLVRKSKNER